MLERQLPPLPAAAMDAALSTGDRHAVDGLLRAALIGSDEVQLRLVRSRTDTSTLDVLDQTATRLLAEGVRSQPLLATREALRAARARLDGHRSALAGVPVRGAPATAGTRWDALTRTAHDVEALGWRLGFIVARELGGPAADDALLQQLPRLLVEDPAGLMERLAPLDPDYGHLLVERARLDRLIAAQPAVATEIPRDRRWPNLRHGDVHELLSLVRARLRELGESAPPVDSPEIFDASLDGALRRVQERHSLLESGTLTEPTLAVLRAPLSRQRDAVDAALEAIRRHPLRGVPDRMQVNIAAYELRVFMAGKVVSRHKTVVGNNDTVPGGNGPRYINRTPILGTHITDVVLNPSWFVPRRIKEQELDPIASRNPAFYDDFELWVGNDGVERAMQLPGRRNALGRVKFVIQGGGGVFLHDTPRKRAFTRRTRAISHGCVRVEDAEGLMRRVLRHDGHQVDPQVAQAILANGREVIVTLNRPVPVTLEYRTVSVDEEGRVTYHPDVYQLGPVQLPDEIVTPTGAVRRR